jgi:hypothetical protein
MAQSLESKQRSVLRMKLESWDTNLVVGTKALA